MASGTVSTRRECDSASAGADSSELGSYEAGLVAGRGGAVWYDKLV